MEVKSAYRSLMRDLHPDLALSSQDEEMQSQANTLAVLLNEIVSCTDGAVVWCIVLLRCAHQACKDLACKACNGSALLTYCKEPESK